MLRTLHIETGRHLYGGAYQAAHLVKGLVARGHRATLLCAEGSGIQREVEGSAPVRAVPFRRELDVSFIWRAVRIIREEDPDVVHLHSRRGSDIMGSIAARLCRVPVVVISRRVDDPIRQNLWNRIRFQSLCDRVVAISEGIRLVVLEAGIPEDRVRLVHSAVNTSEYRLPRERGWFASEFAVAEGECALGVVAQLIERKGHAFLLRAMPEILRRFPRCKLLFFGKGPAEAYLRKLVESLGLTGVVTFVGFRDDLPRILPNLDLVVHPALNEGLGVSLLQVAACGVPIVAAAVGGIPEIIIDGQTGWLIPPSDSQAIEEAVCEALGTPDLRDRIVRAALEHVEANFGLSQMVEGNLRVYFDTLLAKGYGDRITRNIPNS